jgi:26S proteasome non-ATPase regulatory subunit 10
MSATSAAGKHGTIAVVEFLLAAGADPSLCNNNGQSPLHYCKGQADVAARLMNPPRLEGEAEEAFVKRRRRLINKRDKYGQSALHRAATANFRAVVEALVDAGCKINAKDRDGNTALHLACESGHEALALYLVQSGVDKTVVNRDGKVAADLKPTCHLDY